VLLTNTVKQQSTSASINVLDSSQLNVICRGLFFVFNQVTLVELLIITVFCVQSGDVGGIVDHHCFLCSIR
jgi:hypothetical protein